MRNPVSERGNDTGFQPLAPRIDGLDGKRIGLFENSKPAAEPVATVLRERLAERYPGATFSRYSARARDEAGLRQVAAWATAETDACIAAVGDCGGCTRATVQATNAIEECSIPTVGLVADGFQLSWEANAADQGRALRFQPLPIQSETTDVDVIRERLSTAVLDGIETALTAPPTGDEAGTED